LPRARLAAAAMDVHDLPPRALPAAQLGDPRRRLRPLGPRPHGLPSDEPPAARREHRPSLPSDRGAALPGTPPCGESERSGHWVRRRVRCTLLRAPSSARGAGCLGVVAARCAFGRLLSADAARLPAHAGRGGPDARALARGLARCVRAVAALQRVGDDAAGGPARSRRLSPAPPREAAADGAVRPAREDPVCRAGGGRRAPGRPRSGGRGDAPARPAWPARTPRPGRLRALLLSGEDPASAPPLPALPPRAAARSLAPPLPALARHGGGDLRGASPPPA